MKKQINSFGLSILFIALAMLCLTGCKKNDEKVLPPATTRGLNTFGCKVNGELMVANKTRYANGKPQFTMDGIYASEIEDVENKVESNIKDIRITIDKNTVAVGTTYKLGDYDIIVAIYSNRNTQNITTYYYTDFKNTGTIYFSRVDTVNKIYSGTFSFDCIDKNGQKVSITDGRFDIGQQENHSPLL